MKKNSTSETRAIDNRKISGPMKVGMVVTAIAIIIMLILLWMPSWGDYKSAPTLIVTGDVDTVPARSFTNSIHAAGFNLEIDDDLEDLDVDGEEYIILAIGDSACKTINLYGSSDSVLGFVLVCPSYPKDNTLDGTGKNYPNKDIAIFAGADDADSVSTIGDARAIYERLSGDDTVYGTPIRRGGLFASKCYANNNQNRWLSLSSSNVSNVSNLMSSPVFQNELAGYLSVAYGNYLSQSASMGRINSWFILAVVSAFVALIGLLLFLADVPANKIRKDVWQEEKTALYTIISCSFAVVIALTAIILSRFESTKSFIDAILYFPVIMCIFTVVMHAKAVMTSLRGNPRRALVRDIIMALMVIVPLMLFAWIVLDAFRMVTWFVLVAAIIDGLLIKFIVGSAQHTGRAPLVVILLSSLVTSVVMILVGMVIKDSMLSSAGVGLLICALLPHIASFPMRNHSGNSVLAGVCHGVGMLVALGISL